MKRLSELEHTILGIVHKRAPCTSYVVAREFLTSPSSHWRGSAGSVYPAVARLHRSGMLMKSTGKNLGRRCSLYSLSPRGLRQLQNWLTPPLPESAASITFDPIRTRCYFLSALRPSEQVAFLSDAVKQLEAQLPLLEAECKKYRQSGDWFSEQAQQGTLILTQARLDWLRAYLKSLKVRLSQSS